jgi:hypothetical protein
MQIHALLGASVLVAGLLLGACDSSSTSTAPIPETPVTPTLTVNGTMTIAGKDWPVSVLGVYNKDSLSIVISTDLKVDEHPTGWIVVVDMLPGPGTHALAKDSSIIPEVGASYWPNPDQSAACSYRVAEGSFRIDTWTATSIGAKEKVKLSGGASIILIPSEYTPNCEGATAELVFTDADAEFLDVELHTRSK